MARKTELKAVSYVTINESPVLWESLSDESRRECIGNIMKNVGDSLSIYFSENPEEAGNFEGLTKE